MEFPFIEAIVTFFGILLSWIIFYFQRRQSEIQLIERSFDSLQRINEKALESSENVVAAMKSIRADEEFTVDEARIYYFNYMRLNRLYRMWIYMEKGIVSKGEAMDVIRSGLPSVKESEKYLENLLIRAYSPTFTTFVKEQLKDIGVPPRISSVNKAS